MSEIQMFLKCIEIKEDELVQYKVNGTEKCTVRPKLELATFAWYKPKVHALTNGAKKSLNNIYLVTQVFQLFSLWG